MYFYCISGHLFRSLMVDIWMLIFMWFVEIKVHWYINYAICILISAMKLDLWGMHHMHCICTKACLNPQLFLEPPMQLHTKGFSFKTVERNWTKLNETILFSAIEYFRYRNTISEWCHSNCNIVSHVIFNFIQSPWNYTKNKVIFILNKNVIK